MVAEKVCVQELAEVVSFFTKECVNLQVQRKINLVYGGGSIGLMGKIAQTVDASGGHVIGYV